MNPKHLHIAISSDANYIMQASVLLASLFDNNKDFDKITVHLLAGNIDGHDIDVISRQILHCRGNLVVYPMGNIAEKLSVTPPSTIAISSYSRLFLSSLLPENIDRVIYMDVDALVVGSLYKLWNIDMGENLVAGVLDDVSPKAKEAIGLGDGDSYINSGFLLMNIKQWRKEDTEKKIIDYLVAHDGKVFHHDQGLINAICRKQKILPISYNMVTNFFVFPHSHFKQSPFYTEKEMEEGKAHPLFIHFTAGVANRPWCRNCKHPLLHLYLKYKKETVFKDTPLDADNRPWRLKFLSFLFYHFRSLYDVIISLRDNITNKP